MNSFFVDLKDFETVLVTGIDAAKFLQGQLTCDVHALADNGLTHGAACNNKGRIFAAFILARHGSDFHVLLPNGLAGTFIANLQKFIPFYKCSMQLLPGLKSIGLIGNEVADTLERLHLQIPPPNNGAKNADTRLYNLGTNNAQFILILNQETYPAIRSSIGSAMRENSYDKWELASVLSGHFPFSMEDVDKYTPQELHFDQTGYVSFTKGCYTGQEIIARMHYRGKVKKRLYLLRVADFINQENSIEIVDASGHNPGSPMKQIAGDQTLFAITSLPVGFSAALHTREGQPISYQPLIPDVDPGS